MLLDEWLDKLEGLCATREHSEIRRQIGLLDEGMIRACTSGSVLQSIEKMLDRRRGSWGARPRPSPLEVLGAARMGALLTEVRNARVRIEAAGTRRPKGPRFDPTRIPDAKLAEICARDGNRERRAAAEREIARRIRKDDAA